MTALKKTTGRIGDGPLRELAAAEVVLVREEVDASEDASAIRRLSRAPVHAQSCLLSHHDLLDDFHEAT